MSNAIHTSSTHGISDESDSKKGRDVILTIFGVAISICFIMALVVGYQNTRPNFTIGISDELAGQGIVPNILNSSDSLMAHKGVKCSDIAKAHTQSGFRIYVKPTGMSSHEAVPAELDFWCNHTDDARIWIRTVPGDKFDFRWGYHFTPAPGSPPPAYRR